MDFPQTLTGVIGVVSGAVAAYVALKKNGREERSQVVAEAEKTVELLEKQITILEDQAAESKRQGEEREREWRQREKEWRDERDELKRRITGVEADYRNLVLTVTTMGFCASAATCPNYNPGDRRTNEKS